MKSLSAALLLTVTLGCSGSAETARQLPSESLTLTIVGTNDLHGAILPDDGRGGLALLGGYVRNLRAARARDGGAVLLLDAGDMWQGTMESNLTEGSVVVDAYEQLGYAAAAIGNHDFDFGPAGPSATPQSPDDDPRGALKARAAEADFPLLAANILDQRTGRPVDWPNVSPSVVIDAAGVAVGVIGVTTIGTFDATIAANTGGLQLAPLAAAIAAEANALRASGATVVVVTAHAGGACRAFVAGDLSSCDSSAEIFDVARALPAGLVDAIVAGHSHAGVAHEVNGIPIVQAFSRGQAFGRVDLTVNRETGRVSERTIFPPEFVCAFEDSASGRCVPTSTAGARAATEYAGAIVEPDPAVESILDRAVEQVETLKQRPLGIVADTPIPIAGAVESPLGNLFVDAFLAAVPGADVAVNNTGGGLRANLPAGPVTYGRLFEVFPFGNRLARIDLTGAELRRVFSEQLRRSGRLTGVAGVRVVPACTGRQMHVTLFRPAGEAIDDDERLTVATTDYLALGAMFRAVAPPGGFEIPAGAPIVRDLVAEALTRRGGRIRAADLIDAERPRWPRDSELPFRCGGG